MGSWRIDLDLEPALGEGPIALHRGAGDPEGFGDFVFGQPGEELHFDDSAFSLVDGFQAGERLVDGEDVGIRVDGGGRVLELHLDGAAAAALSEAGSGVVDQDMAHDGGGNREEVPAVSDLDGGLAEEADVDLMDKRRGLKRMRVLFARQRALGDQAQFIIDLGDELIAGALVALAPSFQKLKSIGLGFHESTTGSN